MTLQPGTRVGPYEILSPLGAGGMGEVWRARDTRLGREVAVKVLPARVAGDADALARFEREARAVASLSHPNIMAIHDFGRDGDVAYSVTELLEGETLRARLQEGPLPVRKAVDYAQQIARGLAAAQDKGVVHRDLKPENLVITADGRVKILDFGLAKVAAGDESPLTTSPTREAGTLPGTVLGTLAYMSPEQVRAQPLDHRTDIFSFGAVLYEMLTGRQAFRRDTAADTMSAILREDPPELSSAHRAISPALERIVRHCLEKNPGERFQSARDLAFHLEAISGGSITGEAAAAPPVRADRRFGGRTAFLSVGLLVGALTGAGLYGWLSRPAASSPPSLRTLTYSGADRNPSASPDGRLIAYSSDREEGTQIWVKQIPGGDEVALTRGPHDDAPRVSPDGSTVLFVRLEGAKSSLYKVSIVGGEPRKIVHDAEEGDWSPEGTRIVFLRAGSGPAGVVNSLLVADTTGHGERELVRMESVRLLRPRWSPDGTTIAVVQAGAENAPNNLLLIGAEDARIRTLALPPPAGRMSSPVWLGSGSTLAYFKSDNYALTSTNSMSGRVIVQDVSSGAARTVQWLPSMAPGLDVLRPGTLVVGAITSRQNLKEVGFEKASAGVSSRWLTRGNSIDRQPTPSPDGQWVLFSSTRSGNLDLWKLSRETGALRRITEDPEEDWDPAFTRDGQNILWSSNRSGHFEIYMSAADGTGARQVTRDGLDAENPTATPDGAWIVYNSGNPANPGIWKVRMDGSEATRLVPGNWSTPDVSPDGKYVAFRAAGVLRALHVARISDGVQVIAPMELPGDSFNARPRWMPDGQALCFIGQNEKGLRGIYVQRFEPGKDTTGTRRPVAGFLPDVWPESLAVSPDGSSLMYSVDDTLESLLLAEGVDGIAPPVRRR